MKNNSLINKIIAQWNLRRSKKELTDFERAEIAWHTIGEHERDRARQLAAYYLFNAFDEKEKRTIKTILFYAESLSNESS